MESLRGLTLTAARPRIIVPLFARDPAALCPLAKAASADPAAELVELRLDPLPADEFLNALALVRGIVDKPLVVTIRTRAEGGELALTPDAYAAHCRALLARGGVDVLDIEWRACGAFRAELRDAAHAAGAAALFSEHHFDATPATDAMADTLTGMADAGADIAKLAVMPRCAADAARLLEATGPRRRRPPGHAAHHNEHGSAGCRHPLLRRCLRQLRDLRCNLRHLRQRPRPAARGSAEGKADNRAPVTHL